MLAEKNLCSSSCPQSNTLFDISALAQKYHVLFLNHHHLCGAWDSQLFAMPKTYLIIQITCPSQKYFKQIKEFYIVIIKK